MAFRVARLATETIVGFLVVLKIVGLGLGLVLVAHRVASLPIVGSFAVLVFEAVRGLVALAGPSSFASVAVVGGVVPVVVACVVAVVA